MRLPTSAGSTLRNAVAILVVFGLAAQVVYLKRLRSAEAAEREALTASVQISTREFLRGAELPALLMLDGAGSATTLSGMCRKGRTTVVLTRDSCPACADVEPLWRALSGQRKDLDLIAVHVGESPSRERRASAVRHYRASADQVSEVARVQSVPAVIVADSTCSVAAAGAGTIAARSLIRELEAGLL